MLRRTLFPLVLLTALWGGLSLGLPAADQPLRADALDACASAGEERSGESNAAWHAAERAAASLSESLWKLRHVHADVGMAGAVDGIETLRAGAATAGHRSHAPPHLLHVPLLI